ncbi:hypothetical protein Tco_1357748, partial [Tanacetum coccineum]
VDVEQLEAELATAVRANDILRCEVVHLKDNIIYSLFQQALKKEESIYRLQTSLQNCEKELSIAYEKGFKITQERDMMCDELKEYSENYRLLSSEVGMLKKKVEALELLSSEVGMLKKQKVEALDEDVLMKEGQITILKDSLRKPFDLLAY